MLTQSEADDVKSHEIEIDHWLASCYRDPLRYVLGAWAWGVGDLALEAGPKPWQRQFLIDLGAHITARAFDGINPVAPIKMVVSSGVGPGKTALLAWILHYLEDTRPDCKCRVTANTVTQLDTATWAEVRKWGALKLTANRWHTTMEGMYHLGDRSNWFAVRTTCAPENAQAFAGWHNRRSSTANFYDEGGTIPDEIFEKGRGIEVDGESFQFIFGQCSRRHGQLYRAVFGAERDQWDHRIIDGYDVVTSDVTRALYAEWEATYGGPDSDYCRVHIRGLPPNADETQFIDHARVVQAQLTVHQTLEGDPLIVGVDVSGGGSAWTVARFRRGLDARSIPPIRLSGEQTTRNERQLVVAKLAAALSDQTPDRRIDAMFIDCAFGAPIVVRLRQMGFDNVFEVNFGSTDVTNPHCLNMRAQMWDALKEWLPKGMIPDAKSAGHYGQRLADDLEGPGFHLNRSNKLVLESKQDMQARGVASPDDADALCWVAGTMVRTPQGPRAIETVCVGDLVATPMGPRRVLRVHESETRELTHVSCSDGRVLVGKGAHRVWTWPHGFVRCDALPLTSVVETDRLWHRCAWWLLRRSSIVVKPSGFKRVAATINPATRRRRSDFYIGASGLTITGLFLLALKSTIATIIGRTTMWPTWSCVSAASTNARICGFAWQIPTSARAPSPRFVSERPRRAPGIDQPQDVAGTTRTGKRRGSTVTPWMRRAQHVVQSSRRIFRRVRGFVLAPASNANPIGDIRPRIACVRAAVSRLRAISIGPRAIVVTAVQTIAVPPTKTYNLTVEHDHVYYANGVLCENCLTFAMPVKPRLLVRQPWTPPVPINWQ